MQRRHARHVAVLLAGTVGVAEDHVVHQAGSMPARSTAAAIDEGRQVIRSHRTQGTAVPPDGRADSAHDPCFVQGATEVSSHCRESSTGP